MTQLAKHVRPPTRRDLGTKIRKLKPVVVAPQIIDEVLSVARGLPPEDKEAGILRPQLGGVVKPTKTTATGDTTKVKLQDPAHIHSFFSLETKVPKRGLGAAKLRLSKSQQKRGLLGKEVDMAAAPVKMRAFKPKGRAALRSLPTITLSFNRIHMDENGEVTFGVTTYPPWMRQRLRAEIYSSYIQMGQRHLPVDPTLYSLVASKLADTRLCGTHAKADSPPLPPPPSPQQPTRSLKRKVLAPAEPKTKKVKKERTAAFEVERIVSEAGAWGGHSRWFVAEWSHVGYEPTWERWRNAGGNPGEPVLTWMPLREVRNLVAFREWEGAAEERAAAAEERAAAEA